MLPDNVLDFLSANNGHILATGSRVICDPAPTDTDEDWVVCVHNYKTFQSFLVRQGWSSDDSYGEFEEDDYSISEEGFGSFKKGHLNIILVTNVSTFNRWATATVLATHFNLLDKGSRRRLFSAILYGSDAFETDKVKPLLRSENRVSAIFSRLYITTVERR